MPVYTFKCNKCNNSFELFATYQGYDKLKPKCDSCQSSDVDRSYDIDMQNMVGSVVKSDSDIKLGDLANRNRDRMSDDHKAHLYKKHNDYKDNNAALPKLPTGMSRMKKGKKTKWT